LASFTDTSDYDSDLEKCGTSYTRYPAESNWVGDDGGSCDYRSGFVFTISTLPVDDVVSQVDFACQVVRIVAGFSASNVYIGGYNGNGQGDYENDGDSATVFGYLDVSADNYVTSSAFRTTGAKSITDLGASANSDVEAARDAGTLFTIALMADTEADANNNITDIDYAGGTNPAQLTITHAAAGGVIYERTLSDSASANDQQQAYENKLRVLISGLNVNDALIRALVLSVTIIERTLSSSISIEDKILAYEEKLRILTSGLDVNDNLIRTLVLTTAILERTLSDSISLEDKILAYEEKLRILQGNVDISDNIISLVQFEIARILTSKVSVNDSIDKQVELTRILSSALSIYDELARDANLTRVLSDNVELTDGLIQFLISASVTYIRTLSDSVDIQDALIREITALVRGYILMAIKESDIEVETKNSDIKIDIKWAILKLT